MAVQDLVSIIIPVYNVEPYLRQCLDNAIGQTYENIEVIIVDDGSPDNCPAICDEYAACDSRVHVIHQENHGLAAARNVGIAAAHGSWIYFIDSDDWCETGIIEHCMAKAKEHSVDLVIFDYVEVCGNVRGKIVETEMIGGLHTAYDALVALYQDKTAYALWHFLFARHLFDGVVFPEGETCEDVACLHELIGAASAAYMLHEVGYCYTLRNDSITQSRWYRTHGWIALQLSRSIDYAKRNYPELVPIAEADAAKNAMLCARGAVWSNSPEDVVMIRKIITEKHLRPVGLSAKGKIGWRLLLVSPNLYMKAMSARKRLGKR